MISVENLSYAFGNKTILSNINFEIPKGSFIAILGANGCGKTTLLRCISGLLTPQQGKVAVDGIPTSRYSARQLARKLALVQQHSQTDIDFSAFEIVLMGRNPYQHHLQNESQADWDIVEQCMKQTNTWHLRMVLPNQMSGGELQRVMIARALAQQTPVLLLDEPTSSLDIAHQFEIMELLEMINREENKTIFIVVHDLNLALRYCPSAILLHNHGIFYMGNTKKALTTSNINTVFGVDAIQQNGFLIFKPSLPSHSENSSQLL